MLQIIKSKQTSNENDDESQTSFCQTNQKKYLAVQNKEWEPSIIYSSDKDLIIQLFLMSLSWLYPLLLLPLIDKPLNIFKQMKILYYKC